MEYVIGLELLRPVFFFVLLTRLGIHWKQAVKDALVKWIPYFLVLCAFFYYRFIYFPQTQTDPEANAPLLLREILSNPVTAIPHLFQNIVQDLSQALIFAWGKPIIPAEINFSQTTTLIAYALGIGNRTAAVLFLRHIRSPEGYVRCEGWKISTSGNFARIGCGDSWRIAGLEHQPADHRRDVV